MFRKIINGRYQVTNNLTFLFIVYLNIFFFLATRGLIGRFF